MSADRRCADLLIRGAGRLMPAAKIDWVEAMVAERAAIGDDPGELAFCAGCLHAAAVERIRSCAPDGAWSWPGAAFGLLLVATALIPGSGTLPLLWAPVAGLLTVLMLEQGGRETAFRHAVSIAFKTGLLSGSILFACGCVVLASAGGPEMWSRIPAFAIAALAVALLTTVSGIAAAPLVSRPPGVGASSAKED